MEFTYEGLVRYGFGFYNPNHAAALICALAPFAWALCTSSKLPLKAGGIIASALLFAALALTYSRSGLLVAALEGCMFALYCGRKHKKLLFGLAALFAAATLLSGVLGRFSYDASVANRIQIWEAGLALFSENPLGVGIGNSGIVASAFLLPEGVECRTLVNSHLTLLCETGAVWGGLWIALIIYALLGLGNRGGKFAFAAWTAFAGMAISAGISSVFDFDVLLNPSGYTSFTPTNILFQWVNLILFCALGAFLIYGKISAGRIAGSILAAAGAVGAAFLTGAISGESPRICEIGGRTFAGYADIPPHRLALFDKNYNLASAWRILKKHNLHEDCHICLRPCQSWEQSKPEEAELILFGHCADFAGSSQLEYIFINPPTYLTPSGKNIKDVYLPKWDAKYDRLRMLLKNWKEL